MQRDMKRPFSRFQPLRHHLLPMLLLLLCQHVWAGGGLPPPIIDMPPLVTWQQERFDARSSQGRPEFFASEACDAEHCGHCLSLLGRTYAWMGECPMHRHTGIHYCAGLNPAHIIDYAQRDAHVTAANVGSRVLVPETHERVNAMTRLGWLPQATGGQPSPAPDGALALERLDPDHLGQLHVASVSGVVRRDAQGGSSSVGDDYAGALQLRDPLTGVKRKVHKAAAPPMVVQLHNFKPTVDLVKLIPLSTSGSLVVRLIGSPGAAVQYRVVSTAGQVLALGKADAAEAVSFDLRMAPDGIYYLQALQGDELWTRCLLVGADKGKPSSTKN